MTGLSFLSQILEDQKPVPQTSQHWNPHVHAGLRHVRRDPPLRLLALRLGPQYRQGPALPLLRQERDKIHHQVARDPPATQWVQAALQAAQGRRDQTQPDALLLDTQRALDGLKRWLQRPWPRYVRTLSSNFCCDPRCMTSVKAVYGTHILRTHSRHAVISTWRCQVIGDVNHRLITALLVIWYLVVFGTKLRSFMPLSCFHYSPFAWLLAADKRLKLNKQLF